MNYYRRRAWFPGDVELQIGRDSLQGDLQTGDRRMSAAILVLIIVLKCSSPVINKRRKATNFYYVMQFECSW